MSYEVLYCEIFSDISSRTIIKSCHTLSLCRVKSLQVIRNSSRKRDFYVNNFSVAIFSHRIQYEHNFLFYASYIQPLGSPRSLRTIHTHNSTCWGMILSRLCLLFPSRMTGFLPPWELRRWSKDERSRQDNSIRTTSQNRSNSCTTRMALQHTRAYQTKHHHKMSHLRFWFSWNYSRSWRSYTFSIKASPSRYLYGQMTRMTLPSYQFRCPDSVCRIW